MGEESISMQKLTSLDSYKDLNIIAKLTQSDLQITLIRLQKRGIHLKKGGIQLVKREYK